MFHIFRAALSAILSTIAWVAVSSTVLVADSPRLILKRAPGIGVGGDCNNPAIWVGDRIHVFASPYAADGQPIIAAAIRSSGSILASM
jgi:hypothetical protein